MSHLSEMPVLPVHVWHYTVHRHHHTGLRCHRTALRLCVHHTALRSCVTILRYARASPYCATLVYPPHYALSRSCGVNCAWRRVSCLRHGFRVTPCTSVLSTSRVAGIASAILPFLPTQSSRNGRRDRRRSRRGRSRAWRGCRRRTTVPAG